MPTERQLAVALRYVQGRQDAPRVIAKGRGTLAQKILEVAKKHGIPIQQDSDLVEVLARLDLGDFIPPELYKAVAEILAHLYRVNKESLNS